MHPHCLQSPPSPCWVPLPCNSLDPVRIVRVCVCICICVPHASSLPAEPAIALLGAMQSMFEASMYSFVFLWTMALSPNKEAIKHGLIFVNFMTACMAGSFLSSVLMKHARPEKYMKGVFAVATAAMAVPMVLALDTSKDPSTWRRGRDGFRGL